MDINENESPVGINELISNTENINLESSLDKSNIDYHSNNLEDDVDTKNSSTIDDLDLVFGREISYGPCQSTNLDNYSTLDSVPDCHSNIELKHNECDTDKAEEITLDKEKDCNNTDGKVISPKKFDMPNSFGSVCDVCSKSVYPMERLMLDKKCYHKSCLRCCKCGKTLNPTVVSKFNNNIFCKPHYIELFRKRGRYDDINVSNDDKQEATAVSPNKIDGPEHNKREKEITISKTNSSSDNKESDQTLSNPDQPKVRVADATKAWSESGEWTKNNSNKDNVPVDTVNPNASVKNLKTMFESN